MIVENLKKAYGRFKIIEDNPESLILQLKYPYINRIFFSLSMVFIFLSIKSMMQLWLLWLMFGTVIIIFSRLIEISDPLIIKVSKNKLFIVYKKYLGGIKELSIDSSSIRGIVPRITCTKSGNYATIQILYSKYDSIGFTFGRQNWNIDLVTIYSEIIAHKFSSLLNIKLMNDDKKSP
jgi:hypothetical protein